MSDNLSLMDFSNSLADAVERAAAATVLVSARPRHPASGIAYASDLILTANHVVEREEEIRVALPDGSEVSASLAGRDPASDLALLRLASAAAMPAAPAEGDPRVGQLVLALGRPASDGIQASQGIVSAIGAGRAGQLERYVRTDAIPYPGFSGGPLIDLQGRVLGLNSSAFLPGAMLTVPVSIAWRTAEMLKTNGRVKRGYLGVRTQVIELSDALQAQLKRSQESGLLLVSVERDSAAERAGLIVGDILAGVEGQPVTDHDALVAKLSSDSVGRGLAFEVLRGGQLRPMTVQVGERE